MCSNARTESFGFHLTHSEQLSAMFQLSLLLTLQLQSTLHRSQVFSILNPLRQKLLLVLEVEIMKKCVNHTEWKSVLTYFSNQKHRKSFLLPAQSFAMFGHSASPRECILLCKRAWAALWVELLMTTAPAPGSSGFSAPVVGSGTSGDVAAGGVAEGVSSGGVGGVGVALGAGLGAGTCAGETGVDPEGLDPEGLPSLASFNSWSSGTCPGRQKPSSVIKSLHHGCFIVTESKLNAFTISATLSSSPAVCEAEGPNLWNKKIQEKIQKQNFKN